MTDSSLTTNSKTSGPAAGSAIRISTMKTTIIIFALIAVTLLGLFGAALRGCTGHGGDSYGVMSGRGSN